jgi:P-type Ca2+ transporter type 2C
VPVDGLFLRGHNVRCDESGATGESDAVKKASFEECMDEIKSIQDAQAKGLDHGQPKKDPFIISGSKVLEGVGNYVVIAVGEKSFNGRIMMGE